MDERKMIVGYDGSDGARDALALGRIIADLSPTAVRVVYGYPFIPRVPAGVPDVASVMRERAETVLENAPRTFTDPDAVELLAVPTTSPPRVLHRMAAEWGAHMIVVGSTRRDGRFGRVAEQVLHGSPWQRVDARRSERGLPGHGAPADRVRPRDTAAAHHARRRRRVGMFDRVVIGYGGSEGSDDALRLGAAVAPVGTAVRVVHAYLAPILDRAAGVDHAAAEEAERVLAVARRRLADRPGTKFVLEAGSSVPRTLQRVALRWPADLIVLGSSRGGSPGQVGASHVTDATLHGSPCPVLIAPVGYRHAGVRPLRRIGVGFPGSSESRCALRIAARLADVVGAELDVIDVAALDHGEWPNGGSPERTAARLDATEAAVSDEIDAPRATVDVEVPSGDPAEILVERSHRLDLLVVGSRGYGALRRLVSGSVSHDVVRHAACPILVLPASARFGENPRAVESQRRY
jgi:nucleotide-binding universal stress UspA family protein